MSIKLTDEKIYNAELAKTFQASSEGLSGEDIACLEHLVEKIIAGRVDVISIRLSPGVQFTELLDRRIREQLDAVFSPTCKDAPFSDPARIGNFSALHVDAQRGENGKFLEYVEIRVHCNEGNHQNVSIPEGREPCDFDPYFVFGRVGKLDIHPASLFQSLETFEPSFVVNLMNPTWNVFRAHGRHHPMARNVPVAHAVFPRVLAQDVLDPKAQFYSMVNDDQSMRLNGKTIPVSINGKTALKDISGDEFGVFRAYELVNYPVGPSRGFGRALVA
ncbi:MAG TPA: hypothetical protein PLT55_03305 [Acidimicrobiia bacterium]|nr:hypothetical protein [Acidimicrobiia bacterium]